MKKVITIIMICMILAVISYAANTYVPPPLNQGQTADVAGSGTQVTPVTIDYNQMNGPDLAAAIESGQVTNFGEISTVNLVNAMQSNPSIAVKIDDVNFLRATSSDPNLLDNDELFKNMNIRIEKTPTLINDKPEVKKKWFGKYGIEDNGGKIKDFKDGKVLTDGEKPTGFNIADFPNSKVLEDGSLVLKEGVSMYGTVGAGKADGVLTTVGGIVDVKSNEESGKLPDLDFKVKTLNIPAGDGEVLFGAMVIEQEGVKIKYVGEFTYDNLMVSGTSFNRFATEDETDEGYINPTGYTITGTIIDGNADKDDPRLLRDKFTILAKKGEEFKMTSFIMGRNGIIAGTTSSFSLVNEEDQKIFYSEEKTNTGSKARDYCAFKPCIVNSIGANADPPYREELGFYEFNKLKKIDFTSRAYFDKINVEGLSQGEISIDSISMDLTEKDKRRIRKLNLNDARRELRKLQKSSTVTFSPNGEITTKGDLNKFRAGKIDYAYESDKVISSSTYISKNPGSRTAAQELAKKQGVILPPKKNQNVNTKPQLPNSLDINGVEGKLVFTKKYGWDYVDGRGKHIPIPSRGQSTMTVKTEKVIVDKLPYVKHWSSSTTQPKAVENYFSKPYQSSSGSWSRKKRNSFVTCAPSECEYEYAKAYGKVIPPAGKSQADVGKTWTPKTTIIMAGENPDTAQLLESRCRIEGCIVVNSRDSPPSTKSENIVVTGHFFKDSDYFFREAPTKLSSLAPAEVLDNPDYNPIDTFNIVNMPEGNVKNVYFSACNSLTSPEVDEGPPLVDVESPKNEISDSKEIQQKIREHSSIGAKRLLDKYPNLQTIQGYDGKAPYYEQQFALTNSFDDMTENVYSKLKTVHGERTLNQRSWYKKVGNEWYYTTTGINCVAVSSGKETACENVKKQVIA
ncbi:hypothetical protein HOD05_03250 [Candidatus Woesearchaeota archaeon]|nr:hypothetical protein [Candidatus Woesearchaeota archaeon]MBT4151391.1 hypothetical protein [Candidatus Woesearchaeota archaeon]MBT4247789.1 hypothetical protein [Candidatus Woesearchaeota archaeon]MBT4434213.1 hypothetical protein [Candidatus Woesearchaeota archaeon]MBT7332065.1 hypothetical protein [Candidatus Woesearchaeota archaeon]